jgi:hypothetical protein
MKSIKLTTSTLQSVFACDHLRPRLSCSMLTPKQMHNQNSKKLKTYNKKAQTTLVVV